MPTTKSTPTHFDPFTDAHNSNGVLKGGAQDKTTSTDAVVRQNSTLIIESVSEMISLDHEAHTNASSPTDGDTNNRANTKQQDSSSVSRMRQSDSTTSAMDDYLSAPPLPSAVAGGGGSTHSPLLSDDDIAAAVGDDDHTDAADEGSPEPNRGDDVQQGTTTPPPQEGGGARRTSVGVPNDSLCLAAIPNSKSGDTTPSRKGTVTGTTPPLAATPIKSGTHHAEGYLRTKATHREGSTTGTLLDAELTASLPPHVLALRPRGYSRSPADLPPVHNLSKLLPPLQIKVIKEIHEKDVPPPLKKNATIPTALPSEMLMPILLRCDFCQKFDSICSNCNKKWKGIVESRRAVLMNNIKSMQHVRKMGIYFGTILYGAQDFLNALITSQPQLKNWCARVGNGVVANGRPADIQLKLADERGRLFGLHVAMAYGKLESAKTLLEAGTAIRRSDSKTYPTEFLPTPIPDEWDDMLQAQQPYVEFRMAERARLLRRDGDFVSAALEYNALLSLNPNNEHAHCGMAKMMYDQGKYEECLAQCQRIIEMDREQQQTGGATAGPSPAVAKEAAAKRQSSVAPASSTAATPAASPARDDGNAAEGGDEGSEAAAPAPPPPPQVVVVSGGIQWAEFGLSTIQELQKAATIKFHETCHAQDGPALKKCGCIITKNTVIRIRKLPFKLIKNIIAFADCSMLWGFWRATKMPLLRNVLERSGAVLCDESIGEMLSHEEGYAELYESISADKPNADAIRHAVLQHPLRPLGLQVKAMADFHTFVIRSSVAGTNPKYKEPDTSVFFPKARKPMEKMKRAVAVKEFCVHRTAIGKPWQISGVGEWEVDEGASLALQAAVQRKKEAEDRAKIGGH